MENEATFQKLADSLKVQWQTRQEMLAEAHERLSEAIQILRRCTDRERAAWTEWHQAQTRADKDKS